MINANSSVVPKAQSLNSYLEMICQRQSKRLVKPIKSVREFLIPSTELIQSKDQTVLRDKGHIQTANIFCTVAKPRGKKTTLEIQNEGENRSAGTLAQSSAVGMQDEPPYIYINPMHGR